MQLLDFYERKVRSFMFLLLLAFEYGAIGGV
jgi:hypothetical protein